MPRRSLLAAPLAAFALLLTPAALPSPADACINGVRHKTSEPTQDVLRAEQALHTSRLTEAWRRARATLHDLKDTKLPSAQRNQLRARAERVQHLAVIRSRDPETPIPQRAQDLQGALQAAQRRLRAQPDDPTLRAEHAEALARLPERRDEARKTLEDLARQDLITSPFAWRALAELRAEAGLSEDAQRAQEQCQKTTPEPLLCNPAAPDPSADYHPNPEPRARGLKSVL